MKTPRDVEPFAASTSGISASERARQDSSTPNGKATRPVAVVGPDVPALGQRAQQSREPDDRGGRGEHER